METFLDKYTTPSATTYSVADFVDWYLAGHSQIIITRQHLRPLLVFASANNILDITSDGEKYVFSMKLVIHEPA